MTLRPLCDVDGCTCPAHITITVYPGGDNANLCMFHERSYLVSLIEGIDQMTANTGMVHLSWKYARPIVIDERANG